MIKNAKIVSVNTSNQCYFSKNGEIKRGDQAYVMSQSDLKLFMSCPSRWLAGYKDGEVADTKAIEWGSLVDCLLLTPQCFDDQYAIAPATYPAEPKKKGGDLEMKPWNRNATYCKDWESEQAEDGKSVIKTELYTSAKEAADRLLSDERAVLLLESAEIQVMITAEWHDPATGLIIPLCALLDVVPAANGQYGNALADLKTCSDANPSNWGRVVFRYGYHFQGAFYLDMYNAVGGSKRTEFRHILQESFAPYEVGRRILSSEYLTMGRDSYREALAFYCRCLRDKVWPGYDDNDRTLSIDGWTITEPEPWMIMAGSRVPLPSSGEDALKQAGF